MKHAITLGVLAACGFFSARALGQLTLPPADEEFIRGLAADSATSKPATGTGSLIVRAAQGTKDGPKVGGESVHVDFYCQHGQAENQADGTLDGSGLAVFPIPKGEPYRAVVTVVHAGIPYEASAASVTADTPDPVIKVTVYETTAATPPWSLIARHMGIVAMPDGLGVVEEIVVTNPTDRTWTASQVNPKALATVILPLPDGASQVALLNPDTPPVPGNAANGQLFLASAIPPGTSRINLQYFIPVVAGQAKIELKAPANVLRTLVDLQGPGVDVEGDSLTLQPTNDNRLRRYVGGELAAGESLNFTLRLTGPGAGQASGIGAGKWLTKVGLGAAAALVIVIVLVKVFKRGEPTRPEDSGARSP